MIEHTVFALDFIGRGDLTITQYTQMRRCCECGTCMNRFNVDTADDECVIFCMVRTSN